MKPGTFRAWRDLGTSENPSLLEVTGGPVAKFVRFLELDAPADGVDYKGDFSASIDYVVRNKLHSKQPWVSGKSKALDWMRVDMADPRIRPYDQEEVGSVRNWMGLGVDLRKTRALLEVGTLALHTVHSLPSGCSWVSTESSIAEHRGHQNPENY